MPAYQRRDSSAASIGVLLRLRQSTSNGKWPESKEMKHRISGLIIETCEPGDWLACTQPGGFSDADTGITINGPRVALDGLAKPHIVAVTDVPAPVRLPMRRVVFERKNERDPASELVRVEIPFTDRDKSGQRVGEVFDMAVSTGILRIVPDDEVKKYWPEAWEAGQTEAVYDPKGQVGTPMADLILQAQQRTADERQKLEAIPKERPLPK